MFWFGLMIIVLFLVFLIDCGYCNGIGMKFLFCGNGNVLLFRKLVSLEMLIKFYYLFLFKYVWY